MNCPICGSKLVNNIDSRNILSCSCSSYKKEIITRLEEICKILKVPSPLKIDYLKLEYSTLVKHKILRYKSR